MATANMAVVDPSLENRIEETAARRGVDAAVAVPQPYTRIGTERAMRVA